jgi:hypothetical protein
MVTAELDRLDRGELATRVDLPGQIGELRGAIGPIDGRVAEISGRVGEM